MRTTPFVRRLILDSLRYWVTEMHVDGFRFDLAAILSRDEQGRPMASPPLLWDIESDPAFANVKLIAEAWDAAGLYQVGSFLGDSWKEWNGRFRDDVRAFVKGDAGTVQSLAFRLTGSPDVYQHEQREAEQSINFITCHDGFTLNDLVSYNSKHNEANGQGGQDGTNDNVSWNCGVEGPSDDPAVEQLRNRQVKNFLALTMLAVGTPMLLMGDEVRRTQRGNNNAYCINDETTWFDWDLLARHADIRRFTKALVALRLNRELPIDRPGMTLQELLRHQPVTWHGTVLNAPDWGHDSHSLAATVTCAAAGPNSTDRQRLLGAARVPDSRCRRGAPVAPDHRHVPRRSQRRVDVDGGAGGPRCRLSRPAAFGGAAGGGGCERRRRRRPARIGHEYGTRRHRAGVCVRLGTPCRLNRARHRHADLRCIGAAEGPARAVRLHRRQGGGCCPGSMRAGIEGVMKAVIALAVATVLSFAGQQPAPAVVAWDALLTQPAAWYATPEAARIADNLRRYQRATGGWPKNVAMTAVLTPADRARVAAEKPGDRLDHRQRRDDDGDPDARPRLCRHRTRTATGTLSSRAWTTSCGRSIRTAAGRSTFHCATTTRVTSRSTTTRSRGS